MTLPTYILGTSLIVFPVSMLTIILRSPRSTSGHIDALATMLLTVLLESIAIGCWVLWN